MISRRHLDIIIASGGVLFAVAMLALGLILRDQAAFARTYTKDQLSEQKITFTAADKLTEQEKTWQAGSRCLTQYAGAVLQTGAQAECYANYYINLHLEESAARAGFPGETYASIGTVQTHLRAQLADAKAKNDPTATDIQKRLDAATALRDTQFRGETLRGLLLTTYGFSIFADRAALGGWIVLGVAAVALVLAIAGFVHALVTPADKRVLTLGAAPAPATAPAGKAAPQVS